MGSQTEAKKGGRWYLYVLACGDGSFYTGITNDLARRLDQHNRGTGSRYTRSRRPVTLRYREGCRDRSSALKKEYAMKARTRQEKEAYMQEKRKEQERR